MLLPMLNMLCLVVGADLLLKRLVRKQVLLGPITTDLQIEFLGFIVSRELEKSTKGIDSFFLQFLTLNLYIFIGTTLSVIVLKGFVGV